MLYSDVFRDQHATGDFKDQVDLPGENLEAFALFVAWMYSWDQQPFLAWELVQATEGKKWIGSTWADAWFLADRLAADSFARYAAGRYIQATVDCADSSFRINVAIANTMAKLIDTHTLDPALNRFARHWTQWCIDSDLKIAQSFKLSSLRNFAAMEKEKDTNGVCDPRAIVFNHWFAECSRLPSSKPLCFHAPTRTDLPVMKARIEKPRRDYYREVRDWASGKYPHLSDKNLWPLLCILVQVSHNKRVHEN